MCTYTNHTHMHSHTNTQYLNWLLAVGVGLVEGNEANTLVPIPFWTTSLSGSSSNNSSTVPKSGTVASLTYL